MQLIGLIISVQLLFSSCGATNNLQSDKCKSELDTLTGQTVYTYVDQKPEYPGGNAAIIKFFSEHYKYPEQETFQASFQLEFIIDDEGGLIAPRIKGKQQNQLTEAEKEALRVLEEMPKWKPGKCNGENVPVKIFFPLKF